MILLQQLTFQFPSGKRALDDVSLSIGPGERVAVMGANGGGKTTFARIVAGLIQPTAGEIRIDLPETLPQASRIGILFQNPDNQMVSSVVENEIAFALENLATPMSEMEERVTETLQRFGIEPLRSRLTHELSGGEKQRVALASVMIANPRILILDEPDSFLDTSGKAALEAELERLHNAQPELIVIRITQYPEVAARYPRLLVFVDGRLAADHQPARLFANQKFCEAAGISYGENEQVVSQSLSWPNETDAEMPATIEIKGLSFAYDDKHPVIDDLSLTWNRGEVIGLTGNSGTGKTTLGLLVGGLVKPTKGELLFYDQENRMLGLRPQPGWVAVVFQQPERQFFLPTCRDEIVFGPRNLGKRTSDDQAGALLAAVGLEPHEFLLRDPLSLSMGEKRRLAFAAVLSMRPSFVIFDEPTCGLDPRGTGRFRKLVQSLKRAGIGQMIISHDRQLLQSVCDRNHTLSK